MASEKCWRSCRRICERSSLSQLRSERAHEAAVAVALEKPLPAQRLREAPEGFSAPAIIDLKKAVYGKSAWAVNKTNLKMLIKLFGEDEQKLVGKKIRLEAISVRNPQTGEIVPSLAVSPRQRC